jgi:hypothetical protein
MLTVALALGLSFIFVVPTYAQNCAGIQNPTERLACYDRGAVPQDYGKTAYEPSITPQMQDARTRLSTAMLEAGLDIEVTIATKDFIYPGGPYPSLHFFGELNRVLIYKLVTSAHILQVARTAGFQSVVFVVKGTTRLEQWRFDISSGNQTCSRDLCFPL